MAENRGASEPIRSPANGSKVRVGYALIDNLSFSDVVNRIIELSRKRESHLLVTPNADHVLQLESDSELRAVYDAATLITCDGTPVIFASYILGTPLVGRITGSDLMPALCKFGAKMRKRIAIVGGPPGAAERAAKTIEERYPGIIVAWTYCPPLGFEKNPDESAKICDALNGADVDFVFLGVGAPKQEKWMAAHRSRLRVGVILGIGAAIEFVAGTTPRAPKILRNLGLEWAYRLVHDPRRLAKRYFRDLYFAVIVAKQLFGKR